MEVKGEEFYHIHRIGNHSLIWTVGTRINWVQKRPNLFFEYYSLNGLFFNDGSGQSLPFRQAIDRFLRASPEYKLVNYENLIRAASDVTKSQCMFIREIIFEEVRKNYFPQLPSRLYCIWVCKEDAVHFWWNTLKNNSQKILKLKLTGTLHKANEVHLIADTFKHDDLRAKAFEYWTGMNDNIGTHTEILFEGIIDVVEEYLTLDDFNEKIK